jgi:cellulose synthase/poly-beta-1,6-N-acetylglucosamine synthase-like glycosyltransferase
MMNLDVVEILFWLAVICILYTYLVYPVLLILFSSIHQAIKDTAYLTSKKNRRTQNVELPEITVVIAAYNEEKDIGNRITNLLSLDYPLDKLTILIGSDGSSDRTDQILDTFTDPRVVAVKFPENRGKINVLNDLILEVKTPITVFSDANTFFEPDALNRLMSDFENPKMGGVCGELHLFDPISGDNKDDLYWKYEQVLKFHESRLNAMLGANGAIYAIRTELYEPLPADTIVDDFCIFMNVAKQGYKLIYNPEAIAREEIAPSLSQESGRRVRIGAGNFQAMMRLKWMLNPFIGWRFFSYVSHKILRWFVPHFMLLALLTNVIMATQETIYQYLLFVHVSFYVVSFIGTKWSPSKKGKIVTLIKLITFFVSMNLSLGKGFIRFTTSRLSATWERTAR